MSVIQFPEAKRPRRPLHKSATGDTLGTALEVHQMLLNCLHMEPLRDHPGGEGSVLAFAPTQQFGPDTAYWAELQFEAVYGVDPFAFVNRVTAYQS